MKPLLLSHHVLLLLLPLVMLGCKPRHESGSEAKQLKVFDSEESKPLIYWTVTTTEKQEFVCRGFCDPRARQQRNDIQEMRMDCRLGLKTVSSSLLEQDKDLRRLLPAIRGTIGLDGELELSNQQLASRLSNFFDRPGDDIIDNGTVVDQRAFELCYGNQQTGSSNFQVRGAEGNRRAIQVLETVAGKREGNICCHAVDPNGKDRFWYDIEKNCLNNTWKTEVTRDASKCDYWNRWICCEVNGSQFSDTRSQCEGNLSGGRVVSEERCKR